MQSPDDRQKGKSEVLFSVLTRLELIDKIRVKYIASIFSNSHESPHAFSLFNPGVGDNLAARSLSKK